MMQHIFGLRVAATSALIAILCAGAAASQQENTRLYARETFHKTMFARPELTGYTNAQLITIASAKRALRKYYKDINVGSPAARNRSLPNGTQYYAFLSKQRRNKELIEGFKILAVTLNSASHVTFQVDLIVAKRTWSCRYQGAVSLERRHGTWTIQDVGNSTLQAPDPMKLTSFSDKSEVLRNRLLTEIVEEAEIDQVYAGSKPIIGRYSYSDYQQLIAAKDALTQFFRGRDQHNASVTSFLTNDARIKYGRPGASVGEETSILGLQIIKANIVKKMQKIDFQLSVKYEKEGTICQYLKAAIVVRKGGKWLISDLANMEDAHK